MTRWTFWESDAQGAGEAAERADQETTIIKAGQPPAATWERQMPTVDRPGYTELARQERAERAAEHAEHAAAEALTENLPAFMEEAIADLRKYAREDGGSALGDGAFVDMGLTLRTDEVERAMLAWLAKRLDVLPVPTWIGPFAWIVQTFTCDDWKTIAVTGTAGDAVAIYNDNPGAATRRFCSLREGELRILHCSHWKRPGFEPLTLQAVAAAGRGTPA